MAGISCYILADTYFISKVAGAEGLSCINICLPLYYLIFSIGCMLSIGYATSFKIASAEGNEKYAAQHFADLIVWDILLSSPFAIIGLLAPEFLLGIFGGDASIIAIGRNYTKIFMAFAPLFMLNYAFGAFLRNDGDPTRAMVAVLLGSISNIILDYVLMFPLGLGLTGAAIATVCAPIVGISICLTHFFSAKNTIRFQLRRPDLGLLWRSCKLGVSAFVGELATAVTMTVMNLLILSQAGNIGLAAYGIIANLAMVYTATFNGIAEGAQPLISEAYGHRDINALNHLIKLGFTTVSILAIAFYLSCIIFDEQIIAVFNSVNDKTLANYARQGLHLYMLGFLFVGSNMFASIFFSSIDNPLPSAIISTSRGFVAIVSFSIALSYMFGMTGIWCSFPASEAFTLIIAIIYMFYALRRGLWNK